MTEDCSLLLFLLKLQFSARKFNSQLPILNLRVICQANREFTAAASARHR